MKRIDGVRSRHAIKHDLPPARERPNPDTVASLGRWILHLPGDHHHWCHYLLSGCSLAEFPGVRPARRHFPGATHEVVVGAVNPEYPLVKLALGGVDVMTPLNYVRQVALPSDLLANRLLEELACEFVNGHLAGEPCGIRGAREMFAAAVNKFVEDYGGRTS